MGNSCETQQRGSTDERPGEKGCAAVLSRVSPQVRPLHGLENVGAPQT